MISVQIDKIIPLAEAKEDFETIISDVSEEGNQNNLYILTRDGKPAVAIVNINYLSELTGDDIAADANFKDDDVVNRGDNKEGTMTGKEFAKSGVAKTPPEASAPASAETGPAVAKADPPADANPTDNKGSNGFREFISSAPQEPSTPVNPPSAAPQAAAPGVSNQPPVVPAAPNVPSAPPAAANDGEPKELEI